MTGMSQRDTWSLDVPLAKYILPRLKLFKVSGFENEKEKEWDVILDKMIFAFEKIIESDGCSFPDFEDEIDEGLALFGKYYRGLWW